MTKLIIGIGNPDEEYQNTRHNVGFMFLDYLAKKIDANDFAEDKKMNALVSKSKIEKTSVVLVKPLCYVNKSGEVVSKLAKFYKVKPTDVVVVQDDLDIEFGSFKNSFEKNSGGHKGIESIIKSLKTNKFYRLRIGTSVRALQKAREQSEKKRDAFVMDFVLAKFSPKDQDVIKKMFPDVYKRLIEIL
ncbi:MAG: Peptidyl-tRNA hydrolase [Candidatus Yanofskybacteria bacterium GW2011_GWA1_39_13]|uniref:Peptidyl-tRNA hydrolase n=1 Tax=Yanofskybacteria sp. (strain GW2011_GWA1_39_13) TaxID=1619019 RepID=A0A0G0MGU2_YANXG|nr:MAG: Peptidyl-tRNA hydrolase [Candidatus Yanofskybacteria bacterium GW2011_GWA1_39_13]